MTISTSFQFRVFCGEERKLKEIPGRDNLTSNTFNEGINNYKSLKRRAYFQARSAPRPPPHAPHTSHIKLKTQADNRIQSPFLHKINGQIRFKPGRFHSDDVIYYNTKGGGGRGGQKIHGCKASARFPPPSALKQVNTHLNGAG